MESIQKNIFLECKDRKKKDFSDDGNSRKGALRALTSNDVVREQSIQRPIVLGSLV